MIPKLGCLIDARFLFVALLSNLCDAAQLLDFPGPISCLDDQIQLMKPEGFNWRSWRNISLIDLKGLKTACDLRPDGNLLTIPKECLNYESGSMVAYVLLKRKNVYKITCHDNQADSILDSFDGPVVECGKEFIMVKISNVMPGFSDEAFVTPVSTWTLQIGAQNFSVTEAKNKGYTLKSDDKYLLIKAEFNAIGIHVAECLGNKFYRGDLKLIYGAARPVISIDLIIVCAKGPFQCNDTHMSICIPPLGGVINYAEVDGNAIQDYGVFINRNENTIAIENTKLEKVAYSSPPLSVFPWNLTVVLKVDNFLVPMSFPPECVKQSNPTSAICDNNVMKIEVFSLQTRPALDVSTVILGNGQCKPTSKTTNSVVFSFPVNDCGTTKKFVDGKLIYENEVHALWKDFPRWISRDSELRETVRCIYDASEDKLISVDVATQAPPSVSDGYGLLSLVLNIYRDETYTDLYSEEQYPVVKTLRDPIFLEVRVLNRNDPDIELVLNDCWATMSQDSTATPQWNVVDGCQENKDDYPTVFHPVSNVAFPRHRKRFEVKAFAFLLGSDVSSNFVYFHCSAVVCSIRSPASICTKSCLGSRRRRDELFLHRHSILASLPGPVFFADSDNVMNMRDENYVVKQVTLGVLPAFGLVALIALAAMLVPIFKRKLQS